MTTPRPRPEIIPRPRPNRKANSSASASVDNPPLGRTLEYTYKALEIRESRAAERGPRESRALESLYRALENLRAPRV